MGAYYAGFLSSEEKPAELDLSLAIKYWQESADQGLMIAQHEMGLCYEEGRGVEKDLSLAIKYYQLAADQGFEEAQQKLVKLNHF